MRKTTLFIAIILLLGLLCGCGSETGDRLAQLEVQIQNLEARLEALEAENRALTQKLENTSGNEVSGSAATVSLTLSDWSWDGSLLTVSSSFARVMSLEADAEIVSCQLRLHRNDVLVDHIPLTLLPGEADNSFELDVESVFFDLSGIGAGDTVTLDLEILLSSGTFLSARGGSWEYQDGALMLIAG